MTRPPVDPLNLPQSYVSASHPHPGSFNVGSFSSDNGLRDFDLRGYRFPAWLDRTPTGAPLLVRTRTIREVVVLEVAGRLGDVVEDLDWAIQLALASGPRGVACDLSAVTEVSDSQALELLATAGRHVRDWHGIPVAMAVPDPRGRDALSNYLLAGQLTVKKSMLAALYAVLRTPTPRVEWLRVSPHPTSPRAAREFVTRTLTDWHLNLAIPSACLVVSELVTNSTLHDGTRNDIDVSIAWSGRALRLTVRDHSAELPHLHHPGLDLHGRGLTIVAGVSRTFGVLPTADGGKVVWAVLDAAGPGGSTPPLPAEKATTTAAGESPRVSEPAIAAAPSAGPVVPTLGESRTIKSSAQTGHVVVATRTTSPRAFTVGRVGPSQRSHPRPYHHAANYLG